MATKGLTNLTLHAYDWKIKDDYDDNGHVVIHAWCLDRDSKPNLIRFHDFPAYCHVELPLFVGHKRINWSGYKAQQVYESICWRLGDNKPFKYFFSQKEKLYYYRGGKKYPMLTLLFTNMKGMYDCYNKLSKPIKVRDLGIVAMKVWETKVSLVRKLLTLRNMKYCQWFNIQGIKVTGEDKVSKLENEYVVERKTMNPIPPEETGTWVTQPGVLSFDIETYSDRHKALPDPYSSKHVAYMISCVYQRLGHPESRKVDIILYGDCDDSDMGNVIRVNSEIEMIDKMTELVNEYDPEIITGYNIFGYDNPYLDTRLKRRLRDWKPMGRLLNEATTMTSFSWGSSGYGHNEINIMEMDGRIMIDLLPIIRRDYKLPLYNLGFVSNYFLGRTKHPVTAKYMFQAYELGRDAKVDPDISLKQYVTDRLNWVKTDQDINNNEELFEKLHVDQFMDKAEDGKYTANLDLIPDLTLKQHAMDDMKKVVDYCIVDSVLVLDIFEKIHCWIALIEMANVVGVTLVELFTRGQQLRVLSQVYDEASKDHIVIDERVVPKMEYSGGFVYEPEPGIYHYIPCLDFKSLYPTVMISYNIDYRTFVPPEMMDKIPDDMCHVIEWEEELERKVENDDGDDEVTVETVHYKYKFIKQEYMLGILPRLLVRLISERDEVRKKQKLVEKGTVEWIVLERRQLAVKVAANSMYGALGAQKGGKLPLPEAAAAVTAKSRESIQLCNTRLRSQGHTIVYGDSVTGDTPILCRANYPNGISNIFYKPISQLQSGVSMWVSRDGDNSGKQYLLRPNNLEVWSDKGFTPIKHIMRHKTKKRIYRITTHTGVVKVTEDHSLLDVHANEITPNNVAVGGELLTHNLPTIPDDGIKIPQAWAWGIFYGDGSCGSYDCPSGFKRSWAINNQNLDYLNKAKTIMEKEYPNHGFRILETMESSGVYKLVPVGDVKSIVNEWRQLFYDPVTKYKKIPDIIWRCSKETREQFFQGYYAADGDKTMNGEIRNTRFCNKGQIGSAGLFLLARSLGYKVSCNTRSDKPDIYRLTLTKNNQRKRPGIIKKIEDLGYIDDYVYDLETGNHHFSAGVGELVVHNTDSTMPDIGITDPSKAYAMAKLVAEDLSTLFPPPMLVEDEEVYHTMLCIKKKMYLCIKMTRDGKPVLDRDQLKVKGVVPARRDNCKYQRDSYIDTAWKVLLRTPMMETYDYLIEMCLKLMRRQVPYKDLIVIKGLGSHYKNKSYCMKVFSDELCKIGKPATPGDRLEYLIVKSYGIKDKQLLGMKMRLPSTYLERLDTPTPEPIDYEYYMEKALMNCIQKQLFQVGYKKELAELQKGYDEADRSKVLKVLHERGYGVIVNQLLFKFEFDKQKVIDYLMGTDLKKIVSPLVSFHIKKRARIVTRVCGEPIKMMVKLIEQKQKCMDVIKSLVPLDQVAKIRPCQLNIVTPTLNMTKQQVTDTWIKQRTAKLRIGQ